MILKMLIGPIKKKKKKKMLIGRICVCNEYYMLIYFIKIHSRW